jgi:hypothetical protein
MKTVHHGEDSKRIVITRHLILADDKFLEYLDGVFGKSFLLVPNCDHGCKKTKPSSHITEFGERVRNA